MAEQEQIVTTEEPTMPEPVTQPEPDLVVAQNDDMSGAYQSHREQFASAAAVHNLEELAARPKKPRNDPAMPPVDPEQAGGILETVGAVAKDTGMALVDLPYRTLVGGARDAIQNTFDITKELGNWLNENVGSLGRVGGEKDPALPEVPAPRSVTGNISRSIVQFLVGFAGAGKLPGLKGWKPTSTQGKVGKAATQGAVADFSVFDANEERLSNLIQEVPALANPVTEFLAADPDDGAAEGRLKNAIEGLGLGVATDGLVLGLKAIREGRRARTAVQNAEESRPAISLKALDEVLGPADAPLVSLRVMPTGQKVSRAVSETADADPSKISGVTSEKGAGDKLTESRPLQPGGERVLDVDGVQRPTTNSEGRPLAATEEEVKEFWRSMGESKVVDSRGRPIPVYHGGSVNENFTPGDFSVGADRGGSIGLAYFTDDPEVASKYAITRGVDPSGNLETIDDYILKAQTTSGYGYTPVMYRGYLDIRNPLRPEKVTFHDIVSTLGPDRVLRALAEWDYEQYRNLKEDYEYELEFSDAGEIGDFEEWAANIISQKGIDTTGAYIGESTLSLSEASNAAKFIMSSDLYDDYVSAKGHDGLIFRDSEAGGTTYVVFRPDQIKSAIGTSGIDKSPEPSRRDQGAEPSAVEGEGEIFINFRRIESSDDIKGLMQQLADDSAAGIDKARRGKQSFEQIEANAAQVNAWETLMSRRKGEPLNAEQSVAARRLWVASTEKLAEVARLAAENPSEANLFAFRKMMATHHAIQQEVIAARTETARALASWRIPVEGGDMERYAAIKNLLDQNGGDQVSRELAQRVAALATNPNMAGELSTLVEKGVYAKTRDALVEAWIMALLSGPKTHIVNMMSNTSVIFQQMQERAVAARISQALGNDGSVELGEATAQWFGLIDGFKDALRYSWKSLQTGETGYGLGKVELPMQGAISSEAFGMSNAGIIGKAVDGIGQVVRVPGRLLGAEDEFFKTIGYRMELNALSLRQATQEVRAGKIPADQLQARIAELRENPPESLKLAAIDQATYQTFTSNPGKFAQKLQGLTRDYPFAKILLPFVRTPANIFNYTLERTPLAPLMSSFRADLKAGGARRDLAVARLSSGTMLMLTAVDMAMSGVISGSGPVDPKEREALMRTGWQPYSVKIGDRWYAYNRLDPIGSTLGLAAGFAESSINADWESIDPADFEEAFVGAVASVASNMMSKTYLSGISEFFEAMSDPSRYAEGYARRLAGSTVPAVVGEVARQEDPYLRDANTLLDGIKRRIPGLSEELPLARDVWGRPISYQSGLGQTYDIFSPIYSKKENPEPIDKEILDQGFQVSKPSKNGIFRGVDMGRYPHAYSRFLELAGNELKHPAWGLGAMDLLNQVVSGNHILSQSYQIRSDGPDGGKEGFIRDVMSQYRELAKRQILEEFPELKREVDILEAKKRELRMPVMR